MHPTINRILRDWHNPEATRARHFLREEMEHFNADVREAELSMKLALSRLLIATGCDTPAKREIALERIRDDLVTLVGERWADIKRRMDDAGDGNVVDLRFPTTDEAA